MRRPATGAVGADLLSTVRMSPRRHYRDPANASDGSRYGIGGLSPAVRSGAARCPASPCRTALPVGSTRTTGAPGQERSTARECSAPARFRTARWRPRISRPGLRRRRRTGRRSAECPACSAPAGIARICGGPLPAVACCANAAGPAGPLLSIPSCRRRCISGRCRRISRTDRSDMRCSGQWAVDRRASGCVPTVAGETTRRMPAMPWRRWPAGIRRWSHTERGPRPTVWSSARGAVLLRVRSARPRRPARPTTTTRSPSPTGQVQCGPRRSLSPVPGSTEARRRRGPGSPAGRCPRPHTRGPRRRVPGDVGCPPAGPARQGRAPGAVGDGPGLQGRAARSRAKPAGM